MAQVVVTGASGFIGSHVCRRLVEAGHRLKVICRRPAPMLAPLANEIIIGDIAEIGGLETLLANVDCVLHLAARTAGNDPRIDLYYRDNVLTTKLLIASSQAAGVRRLILMSSTKVFGDGPFNAPLKTTDQTNPVDEYGRSKLRAENLALEISALSGLEPVIIRPPVVYGPLVKGNFNALMKIVKSGLPLPLGNAKNPRSFVSVWNLCDLAARLIEERGPAKGIWHVSDDHDCSPRVLIEELSRKMKRRARIFNVPPALMRIGLSLFGHGEIHQQLFGSLAIDIQMTKAAFGWSPPVSFDEGLSRTVSWFCQTAGRAR